MQGYVLEPAVEKEIIQNLRDAGCGQDTIAAFVQEMKSGKGQDGQRLLEHHRRSLLAALHAVQKQIDCLDYLLYQLQKVQKIFN